MGLFQSINPLKNRSDDLSDLKEPETPETMEAPEKMEEGLKFSGLPKTAEVEAPPVEKIKEEPKAKAVNKEEKVAEEDGKKPLSHMTKFHVGMAVCIKFGGEAMEEHHGRTIWRKGTLKKIYKSRADVKLNTGKTVKRSLHEIFA